MGYRQYPLVLMMLALPLQAKDCRDISLFNSINTEQLWQDFSKLADEGMEGRLTGSQGAKKAQEYIQHRFHEIGLETFPQYLTYQQPFHYPNDASTNEGTNLIGWLQGVRFPEYYIVITAHFDHLGKKGGKIFYGADDNASGVAALLALAGTLSHQSSPYSVIFVATDAEESGLYGAKAFVRNSPVALNNIVLNINLDMLAEGGRRMRLYVTSSIGNDKLDNGIQQVIAKAGLCLVKGHRSSLGSRSELQKVNWRKASDHAAFAKQAIPYLFIGGDTHVRYHTPEDRVEQIDRVFYTAATETAWLVLQQFNHE
ncbi:M28 family peptidase [Paraglaciecola hydrolytica]|uniref:Peptidase M28 domain-containing protein n=1 Tax=Paraglaciecola hydrolytica TaxID=1799789 RepID=A0A136A230_9ALTE|nr:M28 family peptidase [Paraglaciecola hydrolytica]KXI29263.1 hypothetical protein AX660_14050 [Paraglaciecola hydrolytica]